MTTNLHVTIIGGGISGLSAAWYLQEGARACDLAVQYAVLEASDRWGGKIRTDQVEGFGEPFVIEGGPDSFLTQKPWGVALARELGLDSDLLGTNDEARKVFVLNNGKPTPLPDGVMLIVPTRFMPFALSPLLSPMGKLRMGLDLVIPRRQGRSDETLADFIRRRLGAEALDKIAEPLMSGIYNAEAERQSLLATFPRFRDLEEKHGSLIRGMLASRRPAPSSNGSGPSANRNGHGPKPGGATTSAFVSLKAGTEGLVRALVPRLNGDLRLNTSVDSLARLPDGKYRVTLQDGSALVTDTVVLTTPAYVTANLVRQLAPDSATGLDSIRYVSTGTISLGFRAQDITHPLGGFGLVIPRSEGRPVNAVTWSSTKFNFRAPQGYVLLRAFFGGSRNPQTMDLDDLSLLTLVRSELKTLLHINAEPVFHRIYRWNRANAQYDVGHLDRVDAIEKGLPAGLYVTGSAYRGVGIPDCVHQSKDAAAKVIDALKAY